MRVEIDLQIARNAALPRPGTREHLDTSTLDDALGRIAIGHALRRRFTRSIAHDAMSFARPIRCCSEGGRHIISRCCASSESQGSPRTMRMHVLDAPP